MKSLKKTYSKILIIFTSEPFFLKGLNLSEENVNTKCIVLFAYLKRLYFIITLNILQKFTINFVFCSFLIMCQ